MSMSARQINRYQRHIPDSLNRLTRRDRQGLVEKLNWLSAFGQTGLQNQTIWPESLRGETSQSVRSEQPEKPQRFHKRALLAVLGLALAAALGGCAKSPASSSEASSGSQAQSTAAETETSASQAAASGEKKLQVMASFYPMYDFAKKVGGDLVEVKDMVPAGTEPHDWELSPNDIKELEKADVFIYSGAGMEHWTEDVLQSLDNQHLVSVEASSGISLLPGHEEDEHEQDGDGQAEASEEAHEEDDHGAYDPHVWLAPENAKQEMKHIKDAFVKADPANSSAYEANYESWAAKFDALDAKFKDTLSPLPNKDIVVSHEAFGYLCKAYGLNQVGIEGLQPDSEPDPARMAEVIQFVKEHGVKVIFFEELVSPKVAETIAKETGAQTAVLNPLEGLSDEEIAEGADYLSVMEENLKQLAAALS